MKTNSKDFSGLDGYAFILNFYFCLLNPGFKSFILTTDY